MQRYPRDAQLLSQNSERPLSAQTSPLLRYSERTRIRPKATSTVAIRDVRLTSIPVRRGGNHVSDFDD
jgi:hypothetical protein